jgi:sulfur carrier protein ThiS
MNITINKLHYELPEGATLAGAIGLLQPRDRVEIILPVTGGPSCQRTTA